MAISSDLDQDTLMFRLHERSLTYPRSVGLYVESWAPMCIFW